MKKIILFLMSLIFINCESDDSKPKVIDEVLLGKWKIIEQLIDPGDGSGTFTPINSDKVIEFFSNGTILSNNSLCYISNQVDGVGNGVFKVITEDDAFYDGIILPDNCDYDTKVYYKIEDQNLILWYQCIEGCGEKYIKSN